MGGMSTDIVNTSSSRQQWDVSKLVSVEGRLAFSILENLIPTWKWAIWALPAKKRNKPPWGREGL
jgi:hypothetical protein